MSIARDSGDISFYEDTGSQAKLTWDASAEALEFGDNVKATFGASQDLQVYHTGGASYVDDTGTGNLVFKTNGPDIRMIDSSSNELIKAISNSSVNLGYGSSGRKLETTSTGIDVTGNATFADNGKAIFGASSDLQIYHDGSRSLISDQGFGNLVIRAGDFTVQNPEGTETFIAAARNGSVDLYYDQGTYTTPKLQTTSTGISVTGSVDFGNWTITESGGSLYFATGGTNKMKLDASGNLDVVGSVNSNATIS
jgi:hypothetical protein